MNNRFLDVNVDAVTFRGLSLSNERKIALIATFIAWCSVALTMAILVSFLDDRENTISFIILCCFAVMIADYIFNNRFVPFMFAKWLVKFTPLSVLYERDMKVLDSARSELLEISSHNSFQNYLVYAKINPDIRSEGSIRVMMAQRKGKLDQWIKKPQNLKNLANLVYQIHLVECFIAEDQDRF